MTSQVNTISIAQQIRHVHPERYLSLLLSPRAKRGQLLTVYALDHELAKIPVETTSPFTSAIRMQWLKDAISGAQTESVHPHPILRMIAELVEQEPDSRDRLLAMVENAPIDLEPEPPVDLRMADAHWQQTHGSLLATLAFILTGHDGHDQAVAEAAAVLGWSHLLPRLDHHLVARGQGRLMLPTELGRQSGMHDAGESHEAKVDASRQVVRIIREHASAMLPMALSNLESDARLRPLRLQLIAAQSTLSAIEAARDDIQELDFARLRARLPWRMLWAWMRRS